MPSADLSIDAASEIRRITSFVKGTVRSAFARGVVVGISGGVDSAVTGALCARALGRNRVLGVLMPSDHTPRRDVEDARRLAESWGVRWVEIDVSRTVKTIVDSVGEGGGRLPVANATARVRMVVLYYYSNSLDYLVAGTGDKSEISIGYFTKFGDGGADLLPIAHLYKTQVRALAKVLGVPDDVASKPSSPQLWSGQRATDEIPADYPYLDAVLHLLFDRKVSPREAARGARVSMAVVKKALEMHRRSEHKRALPPSL